MRKQDTEKPRGPAPGRPGLGAGRGVPGRATPRKQWFGAAWQWAWEAQTPGGPNLNLLPGRMGGPENEHCLKSSSGTALWEPLLESRAASLQPPRPAKTPAPREDSEHPSVSSALPPSSHHPALGQHLTRHVALRGSASLTSWDGEPQVGQEKRVSNLFGRICLKYLILFLF